MTSINGHRDINCSYDSPITDYFDITTPVKGQN